MRIEFYNTENGKVYCSYNSFISNDELIETAKLTAYENNCDVAYRFLYPKEEVVKYLREKGPTKSNLAKTRCDFADIPFSSIGSNGHISGMVLIKVEEGIMAIPYKQIDSHCEQLEVDLATLADEE